MRIHVERVIGLLRQKYSILQGILPIDYLACSEKSGKIPLIDRMIRVCAALTNLPHLLFPLSKLISVYKSFISLQTLVRQN